MNNHNIIAPSWHSYEGEFTIYHVPVLIMDENHKLQEMYVLVSFPTYSDEDATAITECYWVSVPEVNLNGPELPDGWWSQSSSLSDVVKELWDNWSITGCIEGVAEDTEPVITVKGHSSVITRMIAYVCSLNNYREEVWTLEV